MPNTPPVPDAPLLSAASLEWITSKSKKWPEKTRKSRESQIRNFIDFAGDKPIDQYNKKHIRDFLKALECLPANWKKLKALRDLSISNAAKKSQNLSYNLVVQKRSIMF